MNNDIIFKNCRRGKELRAPSGFDKPLLPHFSLAFLWPHLVALARFSVKRLWRLVKRSLCFFVVFLVPRPKKNIAEEGQNEQSWAFLSLSISLLCHTLSCRVAFSTLRSSPPFTICFSPLTLSVTHPSISHLSLSTVLSGPSGSN